MGHDHDHAQDHDHDHHDQGHGHSHGHGHNHGVTDFNNAFLIGTLLNISFVVAEVFYGYLAHSVALVADAGHNLGDVLGLLLAWGASLLARRAPCDRYTYGLRRSSILASLFNAAILLVTIGGIAWEAIRRISTPEPIAEWTVIAVASIGILVNGGTALLFASGRKGDLNIRGAFMHMASDAVLSLGVVLTGFVILATGWTWLDPLVSLVIAGFVVYGTWDLLTGSLNLALDGVPPGINLKSVESYLAQLPGVIGVHDLHIWGMSTTETALTAHLVIPDGYPGDAFLDEICHDLQEKFAIAHSTLQVETDGAHICSLEKSHLHA
jgi:cobalt-zinc-cadmium efflux system protein